MAIQQLGLKELIADLLQQGVYAVRVSEAAWTTASSPFRRIEDSLDQSTEQRH